VAAAKRGGLGGRGGRRTVELGEAIRSVLAEDAGPLHLVDAQGAIDRLQASRCARPAVGAQAQRLMRRGSRSASASREAPGPAPARLAARSPAAAAASWLAVATLRALYRGPERSALDGALQRITDIPDNT